MFTSMIRRHGLKTLLLLTLAGCSSPEKNAQAIRDYDYLKTDPLYTSNQGSGSYAIPQVNSSGNIGKAIDIRPPQVGLQIIPGSEFFLGEDDAYLWVATERDLTLSWKTLHDTLAKNKINTQSASSKVIETEWVSFSNKAEKVRYRFEQYKDAPRFGIRSQVTAFQRNGKDVEPTKAVHQQYNTQAINLLSADTELAIRHAENQKNSSNNNSYTFTMGQDSNNIPIILVNLPFVPFWEQVDPLLKALHFKIEDINRSLGEVTMKYAGSKDAFGFDAGEYTLQIGDLNKQSSLNITNSKGRLITPDQLAQFANALNGVTKGK